MERIRVEGQTRQRLDARPRQYQLGAKHRRISGRRRRRPYGLGVAQLDAIEGSEGTPHQLARPAWRFDQIDESAIVVGLKPDPNRASRTINPAANAAVEARELGSEAEDGLRVRVVFVGGDNGEDDTLAKGGPSATDAQESGRADAQADRRRHQSDESGIEGT
jgi:hypothetical protein